MTSILETLVLVLNDDQKALALLRERGVAPEAYAAFVFDDELSRARRIALIGGTVLTLILGGLTFFAALEIMDVADAFWFGVGGAVLGLVIAWGTARNLAGKRWKYLDEPDETSSGFQVLGMVSRMSARTIGRLDEGAWERLKAFHPNLSAARYSRLPTEPKTQKEKDALMRMTPGKKLVAQRLERVQRICAWLILGAVLAFFMEGMFFLFWGWFFVGAWLALEGVLGLVKSQIGVFSETTTLDLYGWPARAFSIFALFLALAIFLVPGFLGMFQALFSSNA